MTLDEFLDIFNSLSLLIFVVFMALAIIRIVWRVDRFRAARQKIPVLLKRDAFLIGALCAYFGLVFFFRLQGFVLTQNPFWVIPSTIVVLSATGYWVWVEYHLDGGSFSSFVHDVSEWFRSRM